MEHLPLKVTGAAAVEEIFADLTNDRMRAAREVLAYLKDNPHPKEFIDALEVAGRRFFEVLRPGSFCAVLIGDLRRNKTLHTLGLDTLNRFKSIGFVVEDVVIKTQNQDRSTEFYYKSSPMRLRLSHEYLLILQKPTG